MILCCPCSTGRHDIYHKPPICLVQSLMILPSIPGVVSSVTNGVSTVSSSNLLLRLADRENLCRTNRKLKGSCVQDKKESSGEICMQDKKETSREVCVQDKKESSGEVCAQDKELRGSLYA
jgi:hypothetical protein